MHTPERISGERSRFGHGRRAAAIAVIPVIGLILLANVWAAAFISAERTIYFWDWSRYWVAFAAMGELFRTDLPAALVEIGASIRNDNYNLLPVLPLLPFEWAFGAGRQSYILAITNVALLPSAALIALIAERTMERRSWPRFLLCSAAVFGCHALWAPALRGFPDAIGVVIASAVVLAYFRKPAERHSLPELAGIGLLLLLLILTRRWYLFWAVSFFPAALLARFLESPGRFDWKGLFATSRALAIIATVCVVQWLIVAGPVVLRMANTDFVTAYAAYRPDLVGAGTAGQIVNHFGVALLAVASAGLVWLMARREARPLGAFLIAQALMSLVFFTAIQGLLGVQHYYLLLPAVGVGLAAAVIAVCNGRSPIRWRAIATSAIFAVVLMSTAATFSARPLIAGPLLPSVRYAPMVRYDLEEIDRLLASLAALKPRRVYVAASSEVLNESILKVGCRINHPALCPLIARTHHIDSRDGFPNALLKADIVVVATPTQYHLRPSDQRVVGLVAKQMRESSGIGSSFEPMDGEFLLMKGVRVRFYRRTAPVRSDDVKTLRQELAGQASYGTSTVSLASGSIVG